MGGRVTGSIQSHISGNIASSRAFFRRGLHVHRDGVLVADGKVHVVEQGDGERDVADGQGRENIPDLTEEIFSLRDRVRHLAPPVPERLQPSVDVGEGGGRVPIFRVPVPYEGVAVFILIEMRRRPIVLVVDQIRRHVPVAMEHPRVALAVRRVLDIGGGRVYDMVDMGPLGRRIEIVERQGGGGDGFGHDPAPMRPGGRSAARYSCKSGR